MPVYHECQYVRQKISSQLSGKIHIWQRGAPARRCQWYKGNHGGRVTTEEHAHEKITSCNNILSDKEKTNPHLGRVVSLAEVVWFVLGFPYTYCNADFVHVSRLPLEHRVGILLSGSSRSYNSWFARLVMLHRSTAGSHWSLPTTVMLHRHLTFDRLNCCISMSFSCIRSASR